MNRPAPSDEVAREAIALAYAAYEQEESALWAAYAKSRLLYPEGRRYINGTRVARAELRRRVNAESYFRHEAAAA